MHIFYNIYFTTILQISLQLHMFKKTITDCSAYDHKAAVQTKFALKQSKSSDLTTKTLHNLLESFNQLHCCSLHALLALFLALLSPSFSLCFLL